MRDYTLLLKGSLVGLCLFLTACASYHPQPLPTQANYSSSHELYTIEPQKGLDITTVAMLAVVNNPDLKLARDDAHIAAAQSFSAGLLPDPQMSYEDLIPVSVGSGSGFRHGYNAGLNYDFSSLLTYSTQKNAAKAAEQQVNLNLLWQEWQVISQARILFLQITSEQKQLQILKHYRAVNALAYQRMQVAVKEENETADNALIALASLHVIDQQSDTLQQQLNQNQYALNQLLNLAPETPLNLIGSTDVTPFSSQEVKQSLAHIATFRPDLLALQAGYKSEDLLYRQEILKQFPAITLGFTRSNDTQNSNTMGLGFSINLPIFNRNQGNVAIAQATRQKLYDDYQQRLNNADSDVLRLMSQEKMTQQQYNKAKNYYKQVAEKQSLAQTNFKKNEITLIEYSLSCNQMMDAALSVEMLKTELMMQRIALQTLLGKL